VQSLNGNKIVETINLLRDKENPATASSMSKQMRQRACKRRSRGSQKLFGNSCFSRASGTKKLARGETSGRQASKCGQNLRASSRRYYSSSYKSRGLTSGYLLAARLRRERVIFQTASQSLSRNFSLWLLREFSAYVVIHPRKEAPIRLNPYVLKLRRSVII
jgi:hypothetical protein